MKIVNGMDLNEFPDHDPFYLSLIAEVNINITNPRANRTLNEAAPTVDLPVH